MAIISGHFLASSRQTCTKKRNKCTYDLPHNTVLGSAVGELSVPPGGGLYCWQYTESHSLIETA